MITTKHKLSELKRELAMRHQVYGPDPGFQRQRQIDILKAVIADYEKKLEDDKGQTELEL